MALQNSGAISLNDIHVEAGGSSGTSVSINDTDVRSLIGKSSGATMSFSEWYGASASNASFAFNVSTNSNFEEGSYSGVALTYITGSQYPRSELIIYMNGNVSWRYRNANNNYANVPIGNWSTPNLGNCYMKYTTIESGTGSRTNNSDFSTNYIRVDDWENGSVTKGAQYNSPGNGKAYTTFDWTIRDGNTNSTATQRLQVYAERDN